MYIECGIQIGDNGDGWEAVSVSQWRLYMKDACAKHALVRPCGIYEILMGYTGGLGPRKKMRIGPTGNAGVVSISVMVETIEGTVGCLAMEGANAALAGRGVLTELPVPNYGYVRSSAILHGRIENIMYNDWVGGNLEELIYADRQGGWGRIT